MSSHMVHPFYRYTPLLDLHKTIRLIALFPSTGLYDSKCSCYLVEAPVHNLPPFEAVSYFWGDVRDQNHAIVLDQYVGLAYGNNIHRSPRTERSTFPLTETLARILADLTPESGLRLLWIDAICIDQSNKLEKAAQIPMMGQIYSMATRVVICFPGLCPHHVVNARIAVDKLRSWRHKIHETRELLVREEGTEGVASLDGGMVGLRPDERHPEDELFICCCRMDSLKELLHQPWFSRVWTVQEVVLAREAVIRAGGEELDWRAAEEACGVALDLNMQDLMDFITIVDIGKLRTGISTRSEQTNCASDINQHIHTKEDEVLRSL